MAKRDRDLLRSTAGDQLGSQSEQTLFQNLRSGATQGNGGTHNATVRVEMYDTLLPGGTGQGKVRIVRNWRNPGKSAASFFASNKLVTISDIEGKTCAMPGETLDVQWRNDLGVFQPVGSSGLVRLGKAVSAISSSSGGLFSVLKRAASGALEAVAAIAAKTDFSIGGGSLFDAGESAILIYTISRSVVNGVSTETGAWNAIKAGADASVLKIGFVKETGGIANNASGTVEIAVTQNSSPTCGDINQSSTPTTVTACNPILPKVWEGCTVALAEVKVPADPDTPGSVESTLWYIVQSNAAYRLKGQAVGKFFPDVVSEDVDNLAAIRGYYPIAGASTTVTAQNYKHKVCCAGYNCTVEWDDHDEEWLLDDCEPIPQMRVRAQLDGDQCTASSTIAVKNITGLGVGCIPDNADLVWDNKAGLVGKDNDYIWGTMQLNTGDVEAEAVELKVLETFETKWGASKFYNTKKTFSAPSCETTEDADIVAFTAVTVGVTLDFTVNGDGTGDLDLGRTVIYCIAGGAAADDTVVFGECESS